MLGQSAAPPWTAESLLKEVIGKYRAARSFNDTGTFADGGLSPKHETRRGSFEICFAQPASLKFDCQTTFVSIPVHVVWWSDERANHVWWSLSKRLETLAGDDLYRTRWEIGTPAYAIPALLHQRYADQHFPHIDGLPPLMMVPDEIIDGTECYHLTLKNGAAMSDQAYDLWIGKSDLLIRKFAWRYEAGWHEEVHRNIQMNVDLPDETFRVAPPES